MRMYNSLNILKPRLAKSGPIRVFQEEYFLAVCSL